MNRVRAALHRLARAGGVAIASVATACMPSEFDALSRGAASSDAGACFARDGGPIDAGFDAATCERPPGPDARPCASCPSCDRCPDAVPCARCDDDAGRPAPDPRDASHDASANAGACALDSALRDACAGDAAPDPHPACAPATRECAPGETETEIETCGPCNTGSRSRTRACQPATCRWSSWSEFGECGGVTAACTPLQTTGCENGDSCGHRVCSDACTWGPCQPIDPNGCLRIGPNHTDEGSNYRCCDVGRWQFCLPDCTWSDVCSPCSAGAPQYCTDCYPP